MSLPATLTCGSADPTSLNLTLGGQGVFLQLSSTNLTYDLNTEILQADVTIGNLIGQAIGTLDGTNSANVLAFFHTGPLVTVGSGVVTVANADGIAAFTGSNQPYFSYPQMLAPSATSQPKTWQFHVPSSVSAFTFSVLIETDVQYPNGWVVVTPPSGTLIEIGDNSQFTAQAYDVVGRPVSRTFSWSSTDNSVVSMNGTGQASANGHGIAAVLAISSGNEATGFSAVQTFEELSLATVQTISGATSSTRLYRVTVPSGNGGILGFGTRSGTGDPDIYAEFNAVPSGSSADACWSYFFGTADQCAVASPQSGSWYLLIHGYSAYTGVEVIADLAFDSPGYDVRLIYTGQFSTQQENAIDQAAARLEDMITGDLPPVSAMNLQCGTSLFEVVDDMVMVVGLGPIDGAGDAQGNTVAQAGPCSWRASYLPASGELLFDEFDIAALEANGDLESTALHEMMHAVGFPFTWERLGMVAGSGTVDPYFTGSGAGAAFNSLGGGAVYGGNPVPMQLNVEGHWRTSVFGTNELMTASFTSGTPQPVSLITVRSFEDIGYQVDISEAEPFTFPGGPQMADLEATADATISSYSPTSNFGFPQASLLGEHLIAGANAGMWTSGPNSEVLMGLVRFDATSIPAGATITQAQLRLRLDGRSGSSAPGRDIQLYEVTSGWSEGVVTWLSRPNLGLSPIDSWPHRDCATCLRDVTATVQGWVDGTIPNNGFALFAPNAAVDPLFNVGFQTRHYGVSTDRPRLLITYTTGTPALRRDGTFWIDKLRDGPVFMHDTTNQRAPVKR